MVAESVVEYFAEESTAPNDQIQGARCLAHAGRALCLGLTRWPGQNFVITGSLQSMSRDQAAEKLGVGRDVSIVSSVGY